MTEPAFTPGSPAAMGYRMPAEWEPHEATWLAWPHNPNDWPGKITPIHWVYGEIVRKLAKHETVRILADDRIAAKATSILRRVGADMAAVEFLPFATNRVWTRDYGPIFLKRDQSRELAVAGLHFNAWAKYDDWQLDNAVADQAAQRLSLPVLPVTAGDRLLCLEGGAIDVNGRGTVITTAECLLDQQTQVRNPGLSPEKTTQALRDALGVSNVIWLERGIVGDDTHGHIDDLCRFVTADTAVLCTESDADDDNYEALEQCREQLQSARLENGSAVNVIELPMPSPLWFDGVRLPASYANFYIANGVVLVPTFNDPADYKALGMLGELFPGRQVVGIHAVDLVWGFGTLHCLSQQQPAVQDLRFEII